MTPAERAVLARYPDAECWVGTPLSGGYAVYAHGMAEVLGRRALGTGPTPEQAWAQAAARLDPPVAPRDGTR